jgi:sulfoxide reductase heme-binding subunit YedZ
VTVAATRALWFATRGTGVVSLVLLTAIVVLGIATSTRARSTRWPRFVVVGLHRNLTLAALLFIALHVVTTVADGFAPIGLKDAVVPFLSPYRPLWLGLGAVAFDLLIALTLTSLLRARIGQRLWRALHWSAYASWPVALMHALGTGTDARLGWMQLLGAASTAAVVAAILYRAAGGGVWDGRRVAAAGGALALPLAIGLWYVQGPARHGWAARAGTPAALLPHASSPATAVSSGILAARTSLPSPPYSRSFAGTLSQSQPNASGHVLVSIRGRTSGPKPGVLWIRLQGEPVVGGGVSMTASGATFGTAANPEAYVGKIIGLEGTRIVLGLRGSSGALDVAVDLRVQPGSTRVGGIVRVGPPSGESE